MSDGLFNDDFERAFIPKMDHLHNRNTTFEMRVEDAFYLRRFALRLADHPDTGRELALLWKRVAANIEMALERAA